MTFLSSATTVAASVAERSPFSGPVATILGSVIAAVVTATAMYLVAKVGRKTGKESSDWQRIEGLWDRVDELETKATNLQQQNTAQARQLSSLESQNEHHEEQISRLERLLAAAYRYIEMFRDDYRARNLTPPAPPEGYIDE